MHGTHDRMVPVRNAELISDQVPDARLHLLDAGHMYPTEAPEVDDVIAAFLRECSV